MKHLLLAIILGIISLDLNAQINKGAILTGGSISYSGRHSPEEFSVYGGTYYEKNNANSLSIKPEIGWFLNESSSLSFGLTYDYYSIKRTYSNGNQFDEIGNSCLINTYMTSYRNIADKLYFTITGNFSSGFGSDKFTGEEVSTYYLMIEAYSTPGLTYFFSDRWAMKCNLGQLYYTRKVEKPRDMLEDQKNVDNDYGLSIDINTFYFGFQYFLRNKSR